MFDKLKADYREGKIHFRDNDGPTYNKSKSRKRKRGKNEPPSPDRNNSVEWVGRMPQKQVQSIENIFSTIFELIYSFIEAFWSGVDYVVLQPFFWLLRNLVPIVLFIALILFVTPYVVDYLDEIDLSEYAPKDCSSAIKHNDCTLLKPLRCENGEYVNRSSVCGCYTSMRAYQDYCVFY